MQLNKQFWLELLYTFLRRYMEATNSGASVLTHWIENGQKLSTSYKVLFILYFLEQYSLASFLKSKLETWDFPEQMLQINYHKKFLTLFTRELELSAATVEVWSI